MAKVIRYFKVTGTGLADGTSVANAATLFSGGAWSTVITAFPFTAGADSLECRILAGTYTITATLSSGSFSAGAPTRDKPLLFVGTDSKGGPLEVPDPDWVSSQPIWDTSTMPLLDFGTSQLNIAHTHSYMMRMTGSNTAGMAGSSTGSALYIWCEIEGTGTNTGGWVARGEAVNSVIRCTSSDYAGIFLPGTNANVHNTRAEGNSSASGGGRNGFSTNGNGGTFFSQCTSIDNPGDGFAHTSAAVTAGIVRFYRCLSYGNGGDGFSTLETNNTASFQHQVANCVIVNNGAYGLDFAQSPVFFTQNRLRDNTSGEATATTLGQGLELNNYTLSGTNADEFVDATSKDFRNKFGSAYWGLGLGPGDAPAPRTKAYFG